ISAERGKETPARRRNLTAFIGEYDVRHGYKCIGNSDSYLASQVIVATHVPRMLVDVRCDAVELEHIEIIGLELAQRIVDARHYVFGRNELPARVFGGTGFGSDDQGVARRQFDRSADHWLGAIGGSGVDDVNPKIECEVDQRDDLGFRSALSQPESAEPATAQTGRADLEPCPAKCPVNHHTFPR